MGQPVSGLRDKFYRKLILEYRKEGVGSFLYRYFWTESVTEFLDRHLPGYAGPVRPEDEAQIRARLKEALRKQPEPKPLSGKKKKESPDFWEELWLWDARVQAGLSSNADYFLWLTEYLAAHDIYYKDTSMWDGRLWLDALLKKGLDWKAGTREPGRREQKGAAKASSHPQTAPGSDRVYTTQLGKDLNQLAEEVRRDRAKIAGRLEGLTEQDRSILTARLKQMALHIKIKNWLQNSGYYLPTIKEKDEGKGLFQRGSREKQDFTMRMFEAYCAGTDSGFFSAPDGGAGPGGWHMDGQGFCLLKADRIEELQAALEDGTSLYLPLGMDPRSGCVFFLAGKGLYRELYEAEETRAGEAYEQARETLLRKKGTYERVRQGLNDVWTGRAKESYEAVREVCEAAKAAYQQAKRARADYEASPARFCFDYLRLDGGHLSRFPWDVGGAFRLRPKFHENARKRYQDMLEDFEWYCIDGDDREPGAGSPREAIREFNQEGPAHIPELFRWAFDTLELQEISPEAAAAFDAARNRLDEIHTSKGKGQAVRYTNYF